ncbi:MAG: ATP-binding cassette domain-containing protein [Vicinamibacterales bacterium]
MNAILSLNNVVKRYDNRRVLSGASFSVGRGEAIGVIGPNGAGKTTLLRIAMGLIHPDAGRIRLDGEPVESALRRVPVAYFAGESTIPPSLRVRAWRNLFHDVDERGENRLFRVLSRGTRQLLGLRTVFSVGGLRLIVLDEPWEGLDPDASRWLSEAMRARRDAGTGILVSSHRLHELAGVCDRYVFLNRGITTPVSARSVAREGLVSGDALLAAFDVVRGRTR